MLPLMPYEQTSVWQQLRSVATSEQVHSVRRLVDHAADLLSRVIETFPTYTLHDQTHATNVLSLMGDLLGQDVSRLSGLEAALLVLSAFYHDLGMVFTPRDRHMLAKETHFAQFLETHPDVQLMIARRESVSVELAERYCRWRHADRIWVHIDPLEQTGWLSWGVTSLRTPLGNLCRSHNLNARDLVDDEFLPTDFHCDCDLLLCAILLRMADILDFDNSRSPQSVYEHLGIGRRRTKRQKDSDVEWRKHLASSGFTFPAERHPGYRLGFIAGPDHPAVEYDLRRFLDLIESELAQCDRLLRHCSDRWRKLFLPRDIDRGNICSNGYTYGEHRFTLDEPRILDLLMGENLYSTRYVFVRELLQNAMDTSRYREYAEHSAGSMDYRVAPIRVTDWLDNEGRRWVRIDDYGMGMTQHIVSEFLLKVGRSFYHSDEFKADLLRYELKTNKRFAPISRFGIGLLTCFLAADRIEISTLHVPRTHHAYSPVRLSLSGLHQFYTLQTGTAVPAQMPSKAGLEPGYRSVPGTSIAVRLDPCRESGVFDLSSLLSQVLLCPPVPVLYGQLRMGGDPDDLLSKPWTERADFQLSDEEVEALSQDLSLELPERPAISIIPLDLTACSPSPRLRGQLLLFQVDPASVRGSSSRLELRCEWDATHGLILSGDKYFSIDDALDELVARYRSRGSHSEIPLSELEELTHRTSSSSARVSVTMRNAKLDEMIRTYNLGPSRWLAHNGITISTADGGIRMHPASPLRRFHGDVGSCVLGIVSLSDDLRPVLSVARDSINDLPWQLCSYLNLAYLRAVRKAGIEPNSQWALNFSNNAAPRAVPLFGELRNDPLLVNPGGWRDEAIVYTQSGHLSMNQVVERLRAGRRIEISRWDFPGQARSQDNYSCVHACAATLLQIGLVCTLSIASEHYELAQGPPHLREGHDYFPPLFFVRYDKSHLLRADSDKPPNQDHRFSQWLLKNAPIISRKHPGIFGLLRRALTLQGSEWRETTLEMVNNAVARLTELKSSITVPQGIVLKRSDL